jgi:branched-chain amino acid transport system permease protein
MLLTSLAVEVALQAGLPPAAVPFRDAFALLIVILVLLYRPQGLFARRTVSVR